MLPWLWPLQPLFCLFYSITVVGSQQTFWPAAVPITVRSPYLNSWHGTTSGTPNPLSEWSEFWTTDRVTALAGFVKVDNTTWKFFGGWGLNTTAWESTAITPTRTLFVARAGPVRLNITFLSPVEPDDLVKQSFPFSYFYIDVETLDGNPHKIQLYSDISGEWVSYNDETVIMWDSVETKDGAYHQIFQQAPQPLTETNDLSDGSTFYYAMSKRPNMVWRTGGHHDLRDLWAGTGSLPGGEDTKYRAISDNFPVFAFSVDLGTITRTTEPIVWAIGQDQDPAVLYSTSATKETPYWKVQYNGDISEAINDFLIDFPAARDRAIALDTKIMDAAAKISPQYADLVSYVTRQVFASSVITVESLEGGGWNSSHPRAFMKEIANGRRANPVEKIYAGLPLYLYINPSYVRMLLEPLLEFQASSTYTNAYAAPDLGLIFPNATGNAQPHTQALEQSSNMLIIAYAHALYTGQGDLLARYYPLFKTWAGYISRSTLYPQIETADSISQSNSTNLALKGIIALRAMSEISKVAGSQNDADGYSSQASELFGQWLDLATVDGHLAMRYDTPQSQGLIYNLYADRLLRTNLIPENVYSMQAAYYAKQQTSVFGFEFDSATPDIIKSPWTMFVAGALRNYTASGILINNTYARANRNSTPGIFPATYQSDNGRTLDGDGSPAMGAMYSLLALDLEPKTITVQSSPSHKDETSPKQSSNAGAIAGAVIGSVFGVLLVLAGVFLWWRKKKHAPVKHIIEYNPNLMLTGPAPYRTMSQVEPPVAHEPTMPRDPTKRPVLPPPPPPPPAISTQRGMPSFTTLTISSPTTATSSAYPSERSTSTAEMLRNEIADLRRELLEIRERRFDDPPPIYLASNV